MRAALLLTVLLVACGSTVGEAPHTPVVSATASGAPSPTTASAPPAVRITVNGTPYDPARPLRLQPTGQPVVIQLAFPFSVDRVQLERWLPRNAATTWSDDRTVQLTVPETEPSIGFKVPETRSADGSATLGLFSVQVEFPGTRVVNIFATGEVYGLAAGGPRTASDASRISADGELSVSGDGLRAVTYQAVGQPTPVTPTVLQLHAPRARTPLTQPAAADGPFALAEWLPDGRLVLVGRSVWIGSGDGGTLRSIADAASAAGGLPATAVLDPAGERVALWAYSTDGHIAIVDLRSGAVTRLAGPFRRHGADARVTLAWSRDGAQLAGTDADGETGPATARVRVVDVATGRTSRTIEGGASAVLSFPNGELVVVRDAGEQGAGARSLGVVMGFDGVEHRRYLGCGWTMSPDARYILQVECGGAGMAGYTIIELIANGRPPAGFGIAGRFVRFLPSGRLVFAS